jgi:type VI secretion system protein VasJ
LAFTSGLPFASGETQAWLATIASAPAQAGGSSELPSQTDALQACLRKAGTLATNGDLQEAVDLLQQQMSTIKGAGDSLYLQVRLCELLLQHRPGAALGAFALSIVETIDRHVLESWDPDLARDGLQIAYQVLTRNEEGGDSSVRLLQRLIKLDAALAVKLIT